MNNRFALVKEPTGETFTEPIYCVQCGNELASMGDGVYTCVVDLLTGYPMRAKD